MVSLERREGAHRQNLRTQGKGQTVIREAGSQDSITSAKDDMIIKKEGRSTAPSAAELKWPEVIADSWWQEWRQSFTAFEDSRCNLREGR